MPNNKDMNEQLYTYAPDEQRGGGDAPLVNETPVELPEDLLTPGDYQQVEEEVKKDRIKGLIQQVGGVLSAVLLFLGTLNVEFSWLTSESIDAFVLVLAAAAALGVSAFTTYKNSHSFKKGQEENRRIKEAKIAEKRLAEKKAQQKILEGSE